MVAQEHINEVLANGKAGKINLMQLSHPQVDTNNDGHITWAEHWHRNDFYSNSFRSASLSRIASWHRCDRRTRLLPRADTRPRRNRGQPLRCHLCFAIAQSNITCGVAQTELFHQHDSDKDGKLTRQVLRARIVLLVDCLECLLFVVAIVLSACAQELHDLLFPDLETIDFVGPQVCAKKGMLGSYVGCFHWARSNA